jgi:hypothetical protein
MDRDRLFMPFQKLGPFEIVGLGFRPVKKRADLGYAASPVLGDFPKKPLMAAASST